MALEKTGLRTVIENLASFLSGATKAREAIKGIGDESVKTGDKSEDYLKNMFSLVKSVAAVGGAVYTAKKAFDFAEEGAQLLRLEQAGESLASSFGTSMNAIVDAVDDAAKGTVARSDIILAANRAMLLGVARNADDMAKLMEVAAVRGRAMGITTTQAFNDIVTGIGRASPLILDNLGIVTGGAKLYEDFAESIGKTVPELTDAEKKTALFNKVIEDTAPLLDDAATSADDAATAFERWHAATKNLEDTSKKFAARTLVGEVEAIDNLLESNVEILDITEKWGLQINLLKGFMDEHGRVVARNWKELLHWNEVQERRIELANEDLGLTRQFVFSLKDQEGALEDLTDATEDQEEATKKAEEAQRRFQEAIDQEYKDLQTLLKLDLSGEYEKMQERIEGVNEREADLRERIAKVNEEISEYKREIQEIKDEEGPVTEEQQDRIDGYKDRIADAKGQLADLRGELGEIPEAIEKIQDAWDKQTKQMIYDLAAQRLATDGLTTEELKALSALAGPKGFGLIDEGGEALVNIIGIMADQMDQTGDQSGLFVGTLEDVQDALGGTDTDTETLIETLEELERQVKKDYQINFGIGFGDIPTAEEIAALFEGVTLPSGPQYIPPLTGGGGKWWEEEFGSAMPDQTGMTGVVSQSQNEANYNLTINTNAPVEPIIEDFRMMRALGGRP